MPKTVFVFLSGGKTTNFGCETYLSRRPDIGETIELPLENERLCFRVRAAHSLERRDGQEEWWVHVELPCEAPDAGQPRFHEEVLRVLDHIRSDRIHWQPLFGGA